MSKVGIIGVGQSKFVRAYPGSVRELVFESFKEAMGDVEYDNKRYRCYHHIVFGAGV